MNKTISPDGGSGYGPVVIDVELLNMINSLPKGGGSGYGPTFFNYK